MNSLFVTGPGIRQASARQFVLAALLLTGCESSRPPVAVSGKGLSLPPGNDLLDQHADPHSAINSHTVRRLCLENGKLYVASAEGNAFIFDTGSGRLLWEQR